MAEKMMIRDARPHSEDDTRCNRKEKHMMMHEMEKQDMIGGIRITIISK
jgi:hypothetical protein